MKRVLIRLAIPAVLILLLISCSKKNRGTAPDVGGSQPNFLNAQLFPQLVQPGLRVSVLKSPGSSTPTGGEYLGGFILSGTLLEIAKSSTFVSLEIASSVSEIPILALVRRGSGWVPTAIVRPYFGRLTVPVSALGEYALVNVADQKALTQITGPQAFVAFTSANKSYGPAPLSVSFQGSTLPVGPQYSYRWDFGDGQSSLSSASSYVYANPGTYFVTLTVTDPSTGAVFVNRLSPIIVEGPQPTRDIKRTAFISGMVTDPAGNPIAGASVRVFFDGVLAGFDSTEPTGLYAIPDVPDESVAAYSSQGFLTEYRQAILGPNKTESNIDVAMGPAPSSSSAPPLIQVSSPAVNQGDTAILQSPNIVLQGRVNNLEDGDSAVLYIDGVPKVIDVNVGTTAFREGLILRDGLTDFLILAVNNRGSTTLGFKIDYSAQPVISVVDGDVIDESTSLPIPDAKIWAWNDNEFIAAQTDAQGHYVMNGLKEGVKVLIFTKAGYTTLYKTVLSTGTPLTLDAVLRPTQINQPGAPEFTLSPYTLDQNRGVATLSGRALWLDVPTVAVAFNGDQSVLPGNKDVAGTAFSKDLALIPGENYVLFFAANEKGAVHSDLVPLTYVPLSTARFRVSIEWSDFGDLDLHLFDSAGMHIYFETPTGLFGNLDLDNKDGFGPENFTANLNIPEGRYFVAVNYFSGTLPLRSEALIIVNLGTPDQAVSTATPYTLTVANNDTGYPITVDTSSWWRPFDILVIGGIATVEPPDTTVPLQL